MTPTNSEVNLQINTEDKHLNIVCLNTVQSNVKCKTTNSTPFCQQLQSLPNKYGIGQSDSLAGNMPYISPLHIKCHLKPLISHSLKDGSGPGNRTGVWCIFCPKIYAFSNKLLGDEREIFVFIFILTVSLLPYTSFLWFVLEHLGNHCLGLEYVSL